MLCLTESASQRLGKAFVVLLRNTTWKCGTVERLVVNYLRQQIRNCRRTHFSVKDMLEHFRTKKHQRRRYFEAIERLEKRGIIKIVSKPFSSSDELESMNIHGGF